MNTKLIMTLAAALTLCWGAAAQPKYEAKWDSLDQRPIPEWYRDAKFGIFIHWGLYSVPSWGAPKSYAEWYWNHIADKKPDNVWWQFHKKNYGESFEYQDFAPRFKAELYDPNQWADIFVRSGARYIVPTSKHHEGFCLWQSAEANRDWGRPWNAVDAGPHRDLLGDLAASCRAKGLHFGFYYSLYEWYNPLWLSNKQRFVDEHLFPQFKDVVSKYKPDIIFSDGEWDLTSAEWKSEALLAWLYNESPCKDYVVVDDRWGKDCRHKHGGYFTTEYGAGMKDASHAWEESRGLGYSYGFNRAESIDDYKSSRELVIMLCDLVCRGGNLLLDIGPNGDGTIPVIMQQRLTEMGDWLKVNGEAIYGTRVAGRSCQWTAGKRPGQEYKEFMQEYKLMDTVGQKAKGEQAVKQMFFTKKPDALYAINVDWPGDEMLTREITVPKDAQVTMLGSNGPLSYDYDQGQRLLKVKTPHFAPGQVPCKDCYCFKITGAQLLPEAAAK